eukprot:2795267-Rhodomonas_salina.6
MESQKMTLPACLPLSGFVILISSTCCPRAAQEEDASAWRGGGRREVCDVDQRDLHGRARRRGRGGRW